MPPCAGDQSHLSPVCAFREPSHSARRDGWTSMLWILADASSFETRLVHGAQSWRPHPSGHAPCSLVSVQPCFGVISENSLNCI